MSSRRLLVLLVLALLVIGGALWLSAQRQPRDSAIGERVLPALAASLNDISELRVITAGEVTAVTLKRGATGWQVMERGGYAADSAKLRKFLLDLIELRIVEQKTSRSEHYAQLGVEDLKDSGAAGVRLDFSGLAKPLSLIIGKTAGARSVYVRLAGSAPGLQIEPQLSVEKDPKHWVDRRLLDIPAERIKQARITTAKGATYTVTRERSDQADFTIPDLPKGRALASPSTANAMATTLAGLSLDDVRAVAGDEDWSRDVARAEYRLFDGTLISISGRPQDEQRWVRVTVSFDPDAHDGKVSQQAAALNKKLEGWVYQIPAYKYAAIFRPLDELLKAS